MGLRRASVTVPGVALVQSSPGALQEGADLRPHAAAILREMAATLDLFLIAQVQLRCCFAVKIHSLG